MAEKLTEAGRRARNAYRREYRRRRKEQINDSITRHWNRLGAQMEAEEAKRKEEEAEKNEAR